MESTKMFLGLDGREQKDPLVEDKNPYQQRTWVGRLVEDRGPEESEWGKRGGRRLYCNSEKTTVTFFLRNLNLPFPRFRTKFPRGPRNRYRETSLVKTLRTKSKGLKNQTCQKLLCNIQGYVYSSIMTTSRVLS